MKDFFFGVGDIFTFFYTDKAITLIFDLRSVQETTDAEEAGLFGHLLATNIEFLKYSITKPLT